MIVLGIESSCDETACAFVKDGRTVMSSVIASQTALHERFGGVVPEIAARQHLIDIHRVYDEALAQAGVKLSEVDAIAVTQGPGLVGALLVGVSFAKGLAYQLGIPLVPVDHVHAHVHGALLGVDATDAELFPALALVVSGGHTNLYYMRDVLDFELVAFTSDDACGECFDKVAKILGLSYPGGPQIEKFARGGNPSKVPMPRVNEERKKLDFSYSGLKTHMAYLLDRQGDAWVKEHFADVCAAFQQEALGQIVRKLRTAVEKFPEAKSILVAGGVSANLKFRDMIAEQLSLKLYCPSLKYCSDNAAMIAAYGYQQYIKDLDSPAWHYSNTWDAYSRYPFTKYQSKIL
jgi:N6-L-threonylcarbamoyladenine synthase